MVPNGWREVKLKDVAKVKGGKRLPKGRPFAGFRTPYPYIRVSDFHCGTVSWANIQYVLPEDREAIKRYTISSQDVYISIAGTIGQVGTVPEELDGAQLTENAAKIVISDERLIERMFLYHVMQSKAVVSQIETLKGVGGGVPKLALCRIEDLAFSLPPLPEQHAIAAVLANWDRAIEQTTRLIEAKRRLKQGLMQQLLTGKRRRNAFYGKWQWFKAGEVFASSSKRNNMGAPLLSVTQDRGVIPRNQLEARVTMPAGELSSFKLVEPGDFVISLRSFQGGLEHSAYWGLVSPAYTVLKPKRQIVDHFYKHYFKSYEFIGRLAIAVIGIRDGKQVSYDDFCTVTIPYPPPNEQQAIADVLDAADLEITLLTQQLASQQDQKQALMQQLLTGQVRVNVS